MSNIPSSTPAVKSPAQLAREMGARGYRIRFFGEGEAIVLKPDDTLYFVSLTGETWSAGCTCIGHQTRGRCKHIAVVGAFRPCDEPGCKGIQEYRKAQTKFGPAHRYECLSCGKTTDPRIVQDRRDERRRQRDRRSVA